MARSPRRGERSWESRGSVGVGLDALRDRGVGVLEEARPLEVKQGTLIVLDGLLPHYSGANRSERSRHAYTLHLIDGVCRYPDDNWLRRAPEMPLRGF